MDFNQNQFFKKKLVILCLDCLKLNLVIFCPYCHHVILSDDWNVLWSFVSTSRFSGKKKLSSKLLQYQLCPQDSAKESKPSSWLFQRKRDPTKTSETLRRSCNMNIIWLLNWQLSLSYLQQGICNFGCVHSDLLCEYFAFDAITFLKIWKKNSCFHNDTSAKHMQFE